MLRGAMFAAVSLGVVVANAQQLMPSPSQITQPKTVEELCDGLRNRPPGVGVLLGGLDTNLAIGLLCERVIDLDARVKAFEQKSVTTWSTCFQYNLTINVSLSPEAIADLKAQLQLDVAKIEEACASAKH
jgi:hypothetical protein